MVDTTLRPNTTEDVAEAVRSASSLFVVGSDRHREWRVDAPGDATLLDMSALSGIVSLSPADQVAIVLAGTPISQIQAELSAVEQTLPFAPFEEGDDPTVAGALSLGLPHRLEGACGTWRDWTLGMTIVRPDGVIAKCGSCAVKNVAGYDVGRLFIGARGTLGVIVEVILKTYPRRALPAPACEAVKPIDGQRWVQRVPLGVASQLTGGMVDRDTATLWAPLGCEETLPRFGHDWVVRSGCGRANLPALPHPALLRRAKSLFDPTQKLNPRGLGG